jgi:hypothetical protein
MKLQNSFKVIGGLNDEPYCRLNSETEIDRVNIKLRKQMTRDLQNLQPFYQIVFHCYLYNIKTVSTEKCL